MTMKNAMMKKRTFGKAVKSLALAVGFTVMTAACASGFTSQVATFHKGEEPKSGALVSFAPIDPQYAQSLEYAHYAGILGSELTKLGFRDAGEAKPDLQVAFAVSISDGREKFQNRPNFNGGFGFGRFGGFGGFGPGFGPGFAGNDLVARTVYHTELRIEIQRADGTRVWEGRVEADVRGNDLPGTMPLMARALFKDYPGKNGVTRKVWLSPKERKTLQKETSSGR